MLVFQATTNHPHFAGDHGCLWATSLNNLRDEIRDKCSEYEEGSNVVWDATKVLLKPSRDLVVSLLQEKHLSGADEEAMEFTPIAQYTFTKGNLYETRARKV